MVYCLVVDCPTGYKRAGVIQYQQFKLPDKNPMRKKWLERINRDFVPTIHSRICAKHFMDTDFVPDKENLNAKGKPKLKKTLKETAIPSLHLKSPKEVKERSTKNSKASENETTEEPMEVVEETDVIEPEPFNFLDETDDEDIEPLDTTEEPEINATDHEHSYHLAPDKQKQQKK